MKNALISLNPALGSIETYIARVNQFGLLSAEEERRLALNLKDHGDLESARQLIMAHLRYVVRIAQSYKGYGLPLADLIQEGNLGLMKAVKRFDPLQGVRLVSFAVHWIKAEIHDYVLKNWRIVKMATTKAQRKLFFNLRKMKSKLAWFSNDEVMQIASDLGVSDKEVRQMEMRLNAPDLSFDLPHDTETSERDELFSAPEAYLADETEDPAYQFETDKTGEMREQALSLALQSLDPRSLAILEKRWLIEKKATLEELAEVYQVSKERIRQLEQKALDKVRDHLIRLP